MTTNEIVKLCDMYQAKADRAYMAYQETGTQAYHWRSRRYEDIADVCRIALNGNDDRERMVMTLVSCRQVLSQWPRLEPEDTIKVLRSLLGLEQEVTNNVNT